MINDLFVFDFDDTLATTVAKIGVARLHKKENDELFRGWLTSHDLFPVDEKTQNGITYFYLPSEDFAKYQKFATDDISENTEDLFDFGDTSGVGGSTKENTQIISILKQAESLQNSRVIIVTARAEGKMETPFGEIESTNRKDIENFLSGAGSSINQSQIFPVGSNDPNSKVRIVKKYIEMLHPKTVHFYDDNELNVDAVHQLCDELRGTPNIIVHKVSDGIPGAGIEC